MKTITIRLNTIETVKAFVNIVSTFNCDIDLVASQKQYVVDAKSIMGVFSLDLSKPLSCVINTDDDILLAQIEGAIASFKA